jgi:hypothetical protein
MPLAGESRSTPTDSTTEDLAPPRSADLELLFGTRDRQDDGATSAPADASAAARTRVSPRFWEALDQMRREIAEDAQGEAERQNLMVSAAEGVALITSSGLVAALLRSESLLALALSYIPVWRRVDPLAILTLSPEERKKREREIRAARDAEDESRHKLGEILDEAGATPDPPPEDDPDATQDRNQGS